MRYQPIQYVELFLAEKDILPKSEKQYKFNLNRFFNWVLNQGTEYGKLSKADLIRYKRSLQEENKTNLTIANYLGTVRLFYRWMEENNHNPNIASSLRIKKEYNNFRKKSLSTQDAIRFLKEFDNKSLIGLRDYAIANLMIRNGLREIEVTRMNIEDIKQENENHIIKIQRKGKTEKNATLPLSEKAMEIITQYLLQRTDDYQEDSPLFVSFSRNKYLKRIETNHISKMIKAKLRAANLDDPQITAHSLRHTTASLLIAAGHTEYDVQTIMGHSAFQTTQIYTRQRQEQLMRSRNLPKTIDNLF